MVVTKRALGANYVTGTGIVLCVLFVPLLAGPGIEPPTAIVGGLGVLAAGALATSGYWLDRVGLTGEQVWRVAIHAGLGIGVVTLGTLLVLVLTRATAPGASESTLLMSSIALGGTGGAVAGTIREFHRSTTTLTRSTEVLSRVLRHNLRNDMTVILGQLDRLESDPEGAYERARSIRATVGDVAALSEQARLVELAVIRDKRRRHPTDVVSCVKRVAETAQSDPGLAVETDLPETAWAQADWMLETAIEHVLEVVRPHDGEPPVSINVDRADAGRVSIRIVNVDGQLTPAEIETLEDGTETPLKHSEGLNLWIVRWIVTGYGGTIDVEDGDACAIVIQLQRTMPVTFGE